MHISALKLPEGVKPTITERDFTVATIVGRAAEEPVAGAAAAEAAVPGAEGAEAAEGAAAEAGDDKDKDKEKPKEREEEVVAFFRRDRRALAFALLSLRQDGFE